MTDAMQVIPDARPAMQAWTPQQQEVFDTTIARGCSPEERALFLAVCKRTGLDPFARQIYAIARWDARAGREVMAIQTSIDGLRVIASRSSEYEGQVGPEWCGPDGDWRSVWTSETMPVAARAGVVRRGFRDPLWAVAHWQEYVARGKDDKPTAMWRRMPRLMLAKCAEALALRKAFPADMSGLYVPEETGEIVEAHDDEQSPIVAAFAAHGVTARQLALYLRRPVKDATDADLERLRAAFARVRAGESWEVVSAAPQATRAKLEAKRGPGRPRTRPAPPIDEDDVPPLASVPDDDPPPPLDPRHDALSDALDLAQEKM